MDGEAKAGRDKCIDDEGYPVRFQHDSTGTPPDETGGIRDSTCYVSGHRSQEQPRSPLFRRCGIYSGLSHGA